MLIRDRKTRRILTLCNGSRWFNELEGKGSFLGSFEDKEAAIAVGRAQALAAQVPHVIHDENGNVLEVVHYNLERPVEVGNDVSVLESITES